MKKSESQQLLSAHDGADLNILQTLASTNAPHYLKEVTTCPCCGRSLLQDTFYFNLLLRASNKQLYKSFRPIARIGSGSFGTVLKVMHQINQIPLNVYAIKQIPIDFDQQPWLKKILTEVDILQRLYHPNVIRYHYCWTEDVQTNINDTVRPHLMILLEYAKGGSLANLRPKTLGRHLTEHEFTYLLYQAALALEHLHSLGIISRDVKPENFLLTGMAPETESERFNISVPNSKLEERVIARDRSPEEINRRQQLAYIAENGVASMLLKAADFGQMGDGVSAGTAILTAPEVFTTLHHSAKSDVFSLGMSFLQLCSEVQLTENVVLYQAQLRTAFEQRKYSLPLRTLLGQMTHSAPNMRPTAAELRETLSRHLYTLGLHADERRIVGIKDFIGGPSEKGYASQQHAVDDADGYSNYPYAHLNEKQLAFLPSASERAGSSQDPSSSASKCAEDYNFRLSGTLRQNKHVLFLLYLVIALQMLLLLK